MTAETKTKKKETPVREVALEDGVIVRDDIKRKPRLIVKKTQFSIKVRLHNQDRKHVQLLYDFITDFDIDLPAKQTEFALTGWIILPLHFLDAFKNSNEFDVRKQTNDRLRLFGRL